MFAPLALAYSYSSKTMAPAPSPKTNPSLSASKGLEAVSALSFLVDSACIELNPPTPAMVMAASLPPVTMTSQYPKRM